MWRTLGKIFAAFAFFVLFLESVAAAVRWWQGEATGAGERLLALLMPLLILIWARRYSVFGCGGGRCLTPRENDDQFGSGSSP